MSEDIFRKGIVFGILLVFLGAGILPICNADMNTPTTPVINEKQVYKLNENIIIPSQFSHESEIEYVTATVEKSDNEKIKSTSGVLNNGDDILDQQQTTQETGAILSGTYSWAQSFKPTLGTLTRIELLLSKWGEVNDIRVSIRNELDGIDLTSVSKSPYEIPTGYYDWVEVDFEDIAVTPGKTYYIICETTGGYPVDPDYSYSWGCSKSDVYQNGDGWFLYTEGGSWRKWTPLMDMCFKTYGILPLEITTIKGGFGVSAILTNSGSSDITNVDWSITVDGNVFMGSATGGTVDSIPADSSVKINSDLVFGFGPVDINVTASVKTASATGYVIGPFVIGVS